MDIFRLCVIRGYPVWTFQDCVSFADILCGHFVTVCHMTWISLSSKANHLLWKEPSCLHLLRDNKRWRRNVERKNKRRNAGEKRKRRWRDREEEREEKRREEEREEKHREEEREDNRRREEEEKAERRRRQDEEREVRR